MKGLEEKELSSEAEVVVGFSKGVLKSLEMRLLLNGLKNGLVAEEEDVVEVEETGVVTY